MKIIDLLVKIANGEEVPKKIKYNNEIREYSYADRDYISDDSDEYYLFFNIMRKGKGVDFANALNDEVEIIEDTPKEYVNVSEEQVLFNNLRYEERQFILKQMRILNKINGGEDE